MVSLMQLVVMVSTVSWYINITIIVLNLFLFIIEPAIGVVRFTFWEARDLRNVEHVTSGKSDPYVRVLSGHQVRARTEVIDNNLNPEWGESVYVPVHSLKENFVLEAMDWNARSKDKTLGITHFKVSDIIERHVGDQSEDPDIWYKSNGTKVDR